MLMIPAPSANVVVPSGTRMNFFSVFVTLGVTAVGGLGLLLAGSVAAVVVAGVIGLLLGMAPQVAKQWERAVVLRLGRFDGLRGAAAEVICILRRTMRRGVSSVMVAARRTPSPSGSRGSAAQLLMQPRPGQLPLALDRAR